LLTSVFKYFPYITGLNLENVAISMKKESFVRHFIDILRDG